MEVSLSQKLKPDQWYNDPRYNMVIRLEAPEEGYQPEYKVQSIIFQMKSPYFCEKIREFRTKEPTAQKIAIVLPKSINHAAYERIHKEIMGYPQEAIKHSRALDSYFIAQLFGLDTIEEYFVAIFDDSLMNSALVWKILATASINKDRKLFERTLTYLDERSFSPLYSDNLDSLKNEMARVSEEDFRYLMKFHNERRINREKSLESEYLGENKLFNLVRAYSLSRCGDSSYSELLKSLTKSLINFTNLEFEDFQQLSQMEIFSPEEEIEILQELNQKEFVAIKKENDTMRELISELEKQRDTLRRKIERVEEGHATRTFAVTYENVVISGVQEMLVAELELPMGKWEISLNFFALKGGNLVSSFFLSLILYKDGVDLNAVPNKGFYCYNPSSNYASPYTVKFFVEVKKDKEKIEIKSNPDNNRNNTNLMKVVFMGEEYF